MNESQPDELRTLVARLSLDQKASLMAGTDGRFTGEAPGIGLQRMCWSDGPAGVAIRAGPHDFPLLTPCPAALAATWDRDLVRRIGEVVGDEAVKRDVQVIHAPNVNLPRSPLGGRNFEQFAEDPWLTGVLATEWMLGVQSRGVACAVKHFVCNDSETERQTMNSIVNETVLREVYALPFELAVKAGAWGIMTAYNRVNGVYCSEHDGLLRIIKDEWGFDGFVMSDFHATHSTVPSIRAGLDVEMPGPPVHYGDRLARAVRDGEVDEALLDEAVLRILRLARRVGRLGDTRAAAPAAHADPQRILRDAAAAGFVLLTNQAGVLPVAPRAGKKVAVIGPHAAQPTYQGATFAQVGQRQDLITPLEAITEVYGEGATVIHEPGVMPAHRVPPLRYVSIVTARDPTVPGMNVDYYVGDGPEPAVQEVRTAGNFIWNLNMPGMGRIEDSGRVLVSAVILPEKPGIYTFHTGSSAAFDLRLNGEEVLTQGPQPPLDDTAVAIRPPILTARRSLQAGVPVSVQIEMRFGPSRAHSLHFGCLPPVPDDLLERAETAAREADVVFLIVGETQDTSVESADRTTTRLPGRQDELIERVCTANPETVVIVNAAHPVDMPWADLAAAVLHVWFPGQEFAPALAAVISGEMEPGGRLPVTFARTEEDYPVFGLTPVNHDLPYETRPSPGYRHFDAEAIEPRFAFGHGLSYADFVYEDFAVFQEQGAVKVRVTVKNTSNRAGKEVVQVYLRQPATGGVKSPIELKGYASLHLRPGEATTADVDLEPQAFAHWSEASRSWAIEAGDYEVLVGRSASDIRFRDRIAAPAGSVPGVR
jgi:beta-glucosidase